VNLAAAAAAAWQIEYMDVAWTPLRERTFWLTLWC
jgi:hypothetical protein